MNISIQQITHDLHIIRNFNVQFPDHAAPQSSLLAAPQIVPQRFRGFLFTLTNVYAFPPGNSSSLHDNKIIYNVLQSHKCIISEWPCPLAYGIPVQLGCSTVHHCIDDCVDLKFVRSHGIATAASDHPVILPNQFKVVPGGKFQATTIHFECPLRHNRHIWLCLSITAKIFWSANFRFPTVCRMEPGQQHNIVHFSRFVWDLLVACNSVLVLLCILSACHKIINHTLIKWNFIHLGRNTSKLINHTIV